MLKLKRLFAFSGLTALAGAAALAGPASADKGECVLSGDLKIVDKDNPTLHPRLVGGEGRFTYRELVTDCIGDTNKDGIPELILGVGVTAVGWYDNTICGTGKALGTIVDISNAPPRIDAALTNAKFGIELVGGTGVFKWHEPGEGPLKDLVVDKDDPASDTKPDNGDKNYSPAGTVMLGLPHEKIEPLPDILAGQCAKAFSISGAVKFTF